MAKKIIVTCGDINGIGPEIALKAISENFDPLRYKLIFISPRNVFEYYYYSLNSDFPFSFSSERDFEDSNFVSVVEMPNTPMNIGYPTEESGKIAYNALLQGLEISKTAPSESVLVTAPISKKAFAFAGVKFPGHTELLAEFFQVKNFAMIFIGEEFNAALMTIHIPLKDVPISITSERLETMILFLEKVFKKDFDISNPRIAVLGLNPHAGEEGEIGSEELDVIAPVVEKYDFAFGPFVPDAFFGTKKYRQFDVVLGMYHDQVLIPFKLLEMSAGVNFTAGLPIVRTSPDHGTAFDIAGKLIANHESISKAIQYGVKISKNRRKR